MPGARICLDTYQVIFFTHQVPLTLKNFFDFQFVHYSFHQLKMLGNYLTPFAKALAKILTQKHNVNFQNTRPILFESPNLTVIVIS